MKRTAEAATWRDHVSPRRLPFQMQQPLPRATIVDRIAFLLGTLSAVWLGALISLQGLGSLWSIWLFIPVWAIIAYLVLPRLHRLLSDLYVPDYFFGRTRTADGLLGDPVNLGVDGDAAQLDTAMTASGWSRADEITAPSTWRIITSTITRRSYPTAPVSPLMLFGRRHDLAYQQEIEGNPKQRHHVRFWHCPPGWLLPGGAHADWMGAATYDTDIGFSLFTLQVTHRIDENTDEERDYVVTSVKSSNPNAGLRVLKDFTTGYHSRNGGGDRFITDGDLPIIDVSKISVESLLDTPAALGHHAIPDARATARSAPLSTVVAVVCIVISALLDLFGVLSNQDSLTAELDQDHDATRSAFLVVAVVSGLLTVVQIVLAWFVLRGGRRSRIVLMIALLLGILTVASDFLSGAAALGLNSPVLSATLLSLALIALSSESAGAWARRANEPEQHE
ncbi:LssY C-terminal domain-containing protein [Arthrobacter sp. Y-9]|uniref:LssY C-terminal domain-containing protein n=1 Tax=Arthrobacter sp. Y-9 TaxID=3039385 RepID=UPI00242015AB|nr:LssY C-terminal domain-containing protein [Arthrobacter sp. Y-9]WFR84303.1 LssY C-terminal domain-containing protein [Arthrobacter sp. Y-9]